MRHLDLFSGIGGFSLGLEATQQIKTVAFCEIDKYCTKVLNKNWPEVPVYNDIKELTYDKLKADGIDNIDIITGGYPCQPFSVAGLKKGVEDPRHLWPEYFRLIKECRPTWIIGENVSGHIKLGLDAVQEDLESQGYSLRTFSVSASSIGANHQRERIWTVAYSQRNYDSQQIKRVNGEEISLQKEHRENDSTTRNFSGASAIRGTRNEHDDVEDTRRRSWGEQFTRNTESTGRGTFEKTERPINPDTTSGPSERTTTMANSGTFGSSDEQERNTRSLENKSKEEERRERSESSIRTETCSTETSHNVANSESIRTRESRHLDKKKGTKGSYSAQLNSSGTELANTDSERGRRRQTWSEDAENVRQSSRSEEAFGWWNIEPDVGRVAHGVSDRTHRLKALGNSVIPHIPYYIAKSILEVEDA